MDGSSTEKAIRRGLVPINAVPDREGVRIGEAFGHVDWLGSAPIFRRGIIEQVVGVVKTAASIQTFHLTL